MLALVVALGLGAGCSAAAPRPGGNAQPFPSDTRMTPEAVVLHWSDALNHDLNEDAATFFAAETSVVAEDGRVLVLRSYEEAVRFNASIACQGRIIGLSRNLDRVWAAFVLDQRGSFACAAPGEIDTARFTVRGGRIVLFEDLPE